MHPLSQKIASIQHRLIWRRRAVAACWILATAIAAALLLGFADYLTRFTDSGLRIMATLAFTAAIAWAAYRWWYLPRQQRLNSLVVARQVERRFPQLRDSLSSAIEFLRQSEDDETSGSAQLRRLVIAEAANSVESLPLDEVIDRKPLRKAATLLGTIFLVVVICLAINASAVGIALARLAAPLGNTQWPRQHHLEFREVPTQMAAGQTFEAELIDTAGQLPDDVRIEYSTAHTGGREVSSEPMTRAGAAMVARRENVRHSFAFRAKGGDDDTMHWNWVEVTELPQLESLTITVYPPAYAGLPKTTADRHLDVLAGSQIEMSGTTSESIRAARILQDRSEPIEATISEDAAGNDRRVFHINPEQCVAKQSGPYRLELVTDANLTGVVSQWNLRVNTDSPPSVSWQRPSDDIHVLAQAVVPIELNVKDDLAIHRVDLSYDRTDKSESDRAARPKEPPINLYRGPDKPPAIAVAHDSATQGDSRVVKFSWDLTPLQLPAGGVLTIEAEASDYQPATGRTVGPRRITIINADELKMRLADQQSQIVRQLERALAVERKTREDIQRIEIQLRDAGGLTGRDHNTLQAAETNQRSVRKMLVDPAEGVPPLVDSILNEIEMNRLTNSEMRETMNRLAAELKRLSNEPLSAAEHELTSARKSVELLAPAADGPDNAVLPIQARQTGSLSRSVVAALAGQQNVIVTLERLIGELSGKADYRRLARLIAELRDDQLAHEKSSRAEIGVETLPLEINELSRAQRANLNKAVAVETAIDDRYEKIEQGLEKLARQLANKRDPISGTLNDAVELCRRLAIGAAMKQTATDLNANHAGQALEREIKIADDLKKVLDMLRNESERRPQQFVDSLKQAEQQLATLRQQLARLRQQLARTEQAPASANQNQLRQLNEQEQNARRDIEQLSRQLDRLQAEDASKSTQSAANQLSNRDSNDKPREASAQRPSPSKQVQKAERDLEKAANELADKRREAEDDLALEFVRRFQADLGEMVQRQQVAIKKTVELDAQRIGAPALSADQLKAATGLAEEERQLADMAKEHSELLVGLGAVRVSLEEAERRLVAAGKLLDERQTGSLGQQAEKLALARLEGMMQAFAQTANEAAPKPNANNPAPADAANNQPQQQRRPTFELLEVKILRMLQADLNERTRQHEQQVAKAAGNPAANAVLEHESRELAAEQGRLAELVQKMVARNNEKEPE